MKKMSSPNIYDFIYISINEVTHTTDYGHGKVKYLILCRPNSNLK